MVVPHSDHAFSRGLPELGRTVAAWVGSDPTRPDLPVPAGGPGEPEGFREVELPEGSDPPLELDE